ncbi:MAG: SDR family NAD(P)-dependent oxidoreductase [Candidatus Latescibacterota bacterium]
MNINLSGMRILVTGGSSGIGKCIVQRLAEAGATVAIHYNRNAESAEKLVAETGNGARAFQADLAQPEACFRLFDQALAAYEAVDALVNNAGMICTRPLDAPEDEWLDGWNRTIMVNLTAAGILTRAAVNHFITRGGGRIINIASRAAFRGDTPEYLAYAAAKSGMVAMSKSIARAFGKQGVKSFVIAPGFVRTPINDPYLEKYGEEFLVKDLALDRLTEPDDVAPTVVFLASGLMDHATGCSIDINAASYVR